MTISYTYDAANRLTEAEGDLSVSFGSRVRNFSYDNLNRMTEATNQQSKVTRSYDDLGRLTQEGQWIRLDGDVAAGFKHLVDANYTSYDLDSQLLSMNMSGNGGAEDLKVDTTYTRERIETPQAF